MRFHCGPHHCKLMFLQLPANRNTCMWLIVLYIFLMFILWKQFSTKCKIAYHVSNQPTDYIQFYLFFLSFKKKNLIGVLLFTNLVFILEWLIVSLIAFIKKNKIFGAVNKIVFFQYQLNYKNNHSNFQLIKISLKNPKITFKWPYGT